MYGSGSGFSKSIQLSGSARHTVGFGSGHDPDYGSVYTSVHGSRSDHDSRYCSDYGSVCGLGFCFQIGKKKSESLRESSVSGPKYEINANQNKAQRKENIQRSYQNNFFVSSRFRIQVSDPEHI